MNLRSDTIRSEDGTNGPILDGQVVFDTQDHIVLPKGTTAQRPSNPNPGSIRFNTTTRLVEQFNGTAWVSLNAYSPGRGVFGGGRTTNAPSTVQSNTLDYINIATTSAAIDFGDLTLTRSQLSAVGSGTRGIFAGGANVPTFQDTNRMDFITFATTGNASTFGFLVVGQPNLATGDRFSHASCGSEIKGVFGGGVYAATPANVTTSNLESTLYSSFGSNANFGELTQTRFDLGACSSTTRGIFGGGNTGTPSSTIEYITFASEGGGTEFGILTVNRWEIGACSSSVRGVFGGGSFETPTSINTVDSIIIATKGNAISYGTLTRDVNEHAACSSQTRGVFAGGDSLDGPIGAVTSAMDYISLQSLATAQVFGNLTVARNFLTGCSDAHGGLG